MQKDHQFVLEAVLHLGMTPHDAMMAYGRRKRDTDAMEKITREDTVFMPNMTIDKHMAQVLLDEELVYERFHP
jgi:hypothetical protein